ncbi:dnaJ homolog subfamily C member 28 isoform X3 [Anabrus simplex]|uniref:dnaJ homolog subfamily C member 28 isoform X3 n=1 Tax=Anabrus simplex TaxID=316456 RepID=UPI0035A3BD39
MLRLQQIQSCPPRGWMFQGVPYLKRLQLIVIEAAYRKLLQKFTSERWRKDEGAGEYGLYYQEKQETVEFDIKHTAPQHRQYLSYDGYGSGTPRERQKQYQKFRAVTAIQNVYNHRLSKVPQGEESGLLVRDKIHIKKNKSSSEIHRLVEDLIQESMARGDFQNLPGAGKPLPSKGNNPYVDFVTHKINEVLIESGFTPEWITLQREIKNTIHQLREALAERRACLGPVPLTAKEAHEWEGVLKKFQPQVVKLNKKINDFNLQVPILNKQMVHFILEHEANNILRNGRIKADCPSKCPDIQTDSQEAPQTIFTLLDKLFRS